MKIINMKHGRFVLVDDEDYELLNRHGWCRNSDGYANSRIDGTTIKMHILIMKPPKGMEVDHINGNKLDNRKENLRIVTHQQNMFNRSRNGAKEVPFKGVYLRKDKVFKKPFRAMIKKNQKITHLGHFATPEEAARAYDAKAKELFGEYAYLNFPEE